MHRHDKTGVSVSCLIPKNCAKHTFAREVIKTSSLLPMDNGLVIFLAPYVTTDVICTPHSVFLPHCISVASHFWISLAYFAYVKSDGGAKTAMGYATLYRLHPFLCRYILL